MTEYTPSPGDVVLDRDDDQPNRAVVVNVPPVSAEDWTLRWSDKTIAEDNPNYPPETLVAVVIYEEYIRENQGKMPGWNREDSIDMSKLNKREVSYYAFPRPRLEPAESEGENE